MRIASLSVRCLRYVEAQLVLGVWAAMDCGIFQAGGQVGLVDLGED